MTTVCCPPAPVAVRPHAPRPWLKVVHRAWVDWRESSRRWAELQALEQLSDSTRRDLGLAERAPPVSSRTLWDHERGLW